MAAITNRVGAQLRLGVVSAAIVVLAGACTGGSSSSLVPSGTPRPTTSVAPELGPAWQSIFSRIRADGSVSTATALQAFALAFGPLPGVTVPPGNPGFLPDGTGPLRWLVGHWADITPAQRAAAVRLIPELGGLGGTAGTAAAASAPGHGAVVPVAHPVLLKATSTQRRSNAEYQKLALDARDAITAKVGPTLDIRIEAHVGVTKKYTAETGVFDAFGGITGTPAKCVITMSPQGDVLLDDKDVQALIAHEVWHCFEGQIAGLDYFWHRSIGPGWIIEGQAEWVGDSLYPNAPLDHTIWPGYLLVPGEPLFKRNYDALGFYAQLESSGTDVWSKLIPMLEAKGNVAAFQASGAGSDTFLGQWASGFFRQPGRGQAWDIVGPGVTQDSATSVILTVGNGQSQQASATPYADGVYEIDDTSAADVLVFSFSGHARVSDEAGHDYLVQGNSPFCHKSGGCQCPGGGSNQTPPLPLDGSGVELAVTGDPGGDSGTVTGMSLDEFCNVDVTGNWIGHWTNGRFSGGLSFHLVQTGTTVTGTATFAVFSCQRFLLPAVTVPVTGVVTGHSVTLTARLPNGAPGLTVTGTVTGSTISGLHPSPCGAGTASGEVKRSP